MGSWNNQPTGKYKLTNRSGDELFSANSFWGFIGKAVLVQLTVAISMGIIGTICCGIISIFE